MKSRKSVALAVVLLLLSAPALANDRMIAGHEYGTELVASGAIDTTTSPMAIPNEIGADFNNFGVGALVTGTVGGALKGAGQIVKGGGKMLIGILDVITEPVRTSTYANGGIGRLPKTAE